MNVEQLQREWSAKKYKKGEEIQTTERSAERKKNAHTHSTALIKKNT